jgi:hypothetical protein
VVSARVTDAKGNYSMRWVLSIQKKKELGKLQRGFTFFKSLQFQVLLDLETSSGGVLSLTVLLGSFRAIVTAQ